MNLFLMLYSPITDIVVKIKSGRRIIVPRFIKQEQRGHFLLLKRFKTLLNQQKNYDQMEIRLLTEILKLSLYSSQSILLNYQKQMNRELYHNRAAIHFRW